MCLSALWLNRTRLQLTLCRCLGLATLTKFFHIFVHASLLKTEFGFGSSNLTIFAHLRIIRTRLRLQLHDKHALPSTHWTSLARARVLDVRILRSE